MKIGDRVVVSGFLEGGRDANIVGFRKPKGNPCVCPSCEAVGGKLLRVRFDDGEVRTDYAHMYTLPKDARWGAPFEVGDRVLHKPSGNLGNIEAVGEGHCDVIMDCDPNASRCLPVNELVHARPDDEDE